MDHSNQKYLENRTFDEIRVGDSAQLLRTLTPDDIHLFALISGDLNPTHTDPDFARSSPARQVVGHSMWGSALISSLLGNEFPGPGSTYVSQSLNFHRPITIGDSLAVTLTCREKRPDGRHVVFSCEATNRAGLLVMDGVAVVAAPEGKIRRPQVRLPEVKILDRARRYGHLLGISAGLPPIPIAVAYPCDRESLAGPLQAARAGLVKPILVGPAGRIRAVAEEHGLELDGCPVVDVPDAMAAASAAVAMCRDGEAEALMKGCLHTDELMRCVVSREHGLRTGRRISHVFLADVPTYPHPLMITDAAISIEPSLEDKVSIVQNAIDLARTMNIAEPRVAILAAVETVNPRMRATLDAAALCKMADRGQITGGVLDGPLAFDNAVSPAAARTKGIRSEVAGRAHILVVPDLEAGNMLAKQLEYLADALMAGVVLGARVPIVLTSRADTAETRAASCAVAQLMAHRNRERSCK
ncbi:bifunctional enoyl-CoA hydratase/phosphate acetyltransferase [Thauera sinica]|uniref:Bifunctional enoyl-CoA hydratase/phosphate acetyltransferase n=1 Tax=Thauera sinica TaxID=2665146 RepID=A0ABW1AQY7_9RHOO|nr:bifunctional enoyl-CoA hydratase/phosphate acetyltransferase [Thauera sp. K11]ATE59522.1 enoyl-CoA hydratase [Thauera sp. K11]